MFWKRRGTSPSAIDGAAARELEPDLHPIHVFLEDRVVAGEIEGGSERLSDVLASGRALRLQREDGEWESFLADDVIAVAPPPFVSQRRIHRAKRRVKFLVGPYAIVGTAHLPPGTQLDPFVLRTGRPVLPITDAWITDESGAVDQDHRVVIVSVNRITMAQELFATR